jgi:hypothetical protein
MSNNSRDVKDERNEINVVVVGLVLVEVDVEVDVEIVVNRSGYCKKCQIGMVRK